MHHEHVNSIRTVARPPAGVQAVGFEPVVTGTLDDLCTIAHQYLDIAFATWVVDREHHHLVDMRERIDAVVMVADSGAHSQRWQLWGTDNCDSVPVPYRYSSNEQTIADTYQQAPVRLVSDEGRQRAWNGRHWDAYINLWGRPFESGAVNTHVAGDTDNELIWAPTGSIDHTDHDSIDVVAHTLVTYAVHELLEAAWCGTTSDMFDEPYANHLIGPHSDDVNHSPELDGADTVRFVARIHGRTVEFNPTLD